MAFRAAGADKSAPVANMWDMTSRILIVVTNVGHYADPSHRTGLWLTELTHALEVFEARGFETRLVSPAGGAVPVEPRSLKWPNVDAAALTWLASEAGKQALADTPSPDKIDPAGFDAIYFTGGHAVMFDFTDSPGLHSLTRSIYERGGVVGAVCHGYCGLLNVRLSDDSLLIAGKHMTGFSWPEEVLAGVAKDVPYNAEQTAKDRGALYQKALVPFVPYAVTDGRLVTGQNPASAKLTAEAVAALLQAPA